MLKTSKFLKLLVAQNYKSLLKTHLLSPVCGFIHWFYCFLVYSFSFLYIYFMPHLEYDCFIAVLLDGAHFVRHLGRQQLSLICRVNKLHFLPKQTHMIWLLWLLWASSPLQRLLLPSLYHCFFLFFLMALLVLKFTHVIFQTCVSQYWDCDPYEGSPGVQMFHIQQNKI